MNRLDKAIVFENEVVRYLKQHEDIEPDSVVLLRDRACASVARTKYKDATDLCMKNERWYPDGQCIIKSRRAMILFDAKISHTIEKEAYESYCRRELSGDSVWLFIKHAPYVYMIKVSDLLLEDGAVTVDREIPENRFIVKDKWIYPNRKFANMSSTPYREILLHPEHASNAFMRTEEWDSRFSEAAVARDSR